MALRFVILNVDGFRKDFKRQVVFARLVELSVDIVFLAETHITNWAEANRMVGKFWKGKHFWSFGTNNARGVGILVAKDLDYQFLGHTYDFEGRTVILDIQMGSNKYRLINCYAPNDPTARKAYIESLDIYLINDFEPILGGDWNFVEDLEKDKWGGSLTYGDVGKKQMKKLKDDFVLFDPFRRKYPNRKEHTWRRGPTHCRLDRWYIPDSMKTWVDNVSHKVCTVSDHFFTILDFKGFDNESGRFGPGYWKQNTKVYDDPLFVLDMNNLWQNDLQNNVLKDDFWWENCKVQFKKLIIRHSRKLSDRTRKQIEELEGIAHSFINWIAFSNDPQIVEQSKDCLAQVKKELNDLLVDKIKGAMVRTRAQILEQGEKPTRYFLQLEKKIAKSKLITEVKIGENIITEPLGIIKEVRGFWKNVFTSEEENLEDDAMDYFLKDTGLPRVPPDLVEHCEGQLSAREAKEALDAMKNGKSPGSDGLGCEFYKKFWYLFGDHFVAMINLCFLNGQLTESQRLSLITLLCKDKALHYLLTHWRPISLINVDAKIVSKAICNRLKKVLPYIVSDDQTCSVEGRSISDNIHLLRNVFDYAESKNIGVINLGLDQMKAFDRVEYKWLMKVLECFGFGPDFLRWVTVLYTNLKTSVIINGHISEPFSYTRGVKQGCPLSPLMYVLTIEPFANRIRLDPQIRGLKLPGQDRYSKITQYADDSNLTLTTIFSVQRTLTVFEIYERASGSARNKDKCYAIWLGSFKDNEDTPYGLKWMSHKKLLGIIMGGGHTRDTMELNWGNVFSSFCLTLRENFNRDCSFYGRSLVANSLAVSKIVFTATHITLPTGYCDQFVGELFDFIWSRKKDQAPIFNQPAQPAQQNNQADKKEEKGVWEPIKRETMYAPSNFGGVNVVCIKTKCEALLIKHIFNLISLSTSEYNPKWMAFAIYWVGFGLREFNADFASNLIPHCFDYRPNFYEKAYGLFKNYIKDFPMQNTSQSRPVKQIYMDLMKKVVVQPKIENHIDFVNVDFKPIWKICKSQFLDPQLKTFRFLLAHRVTSLKANLERKGFFKDQPRKNDNHNCTFCKTNNAPETFDHFFLFCPQITRVWDFIQPILFKLCNHRLKFDKELVFYGQLPPNVSPTVKEMVHYVTSLAMYAVWRVRYSTIHGEYGPLRVAPPEASLDFFRNFLKYRMRADFSRFFVHQFSEYWARNEAFCKISDDGISLDFSF